MPCSEVRAAVAIAAILEVVLRAVTQNAIFHLHSGIEHLLPVIVLFLSALSFFLLPSHRRLLLLVTIPIPAAACCRCGCSAGFASITPYAGSICGIAFVHHWDERNQLQHLVALLAPPMVCIEHTRRMRRWPGRQALLQRCRRQRGRGMSEEICTTGTEDPRLQTQNTQNLQAHQQPACVHAARKRGSVRAGLRAELRACGTACVTACVRDCVRDGVRGGVYIYKRGGRC